ncbi:MAG TPA: multiheme c-type cytochrome [Polyangia bacterium]|nr:multiheme c-type cytochrome [Polyangia bacterium]
MNVTPRSPRPRPAPAPLPALAVVLALACARSAPAPTPPPPPRAPEVAAAPKPAAPRADLALVYTSDLRGRISAHEISRPLPPGVGLTPLAHKESTAGLARRATIVDRARLDAAALVQVDAGDFLPLPTDAPRDPVAPTVADQGKWLDLVVAGYRRLGVDAVTLGERELAQPGLDPARLAAKLKAAHVPVVLANLVDRGGAPAFAADVLIDAGAAKVGVVGVSEVDQATIVTLAKAGYALTNATDAAQRSARSLRARGATIVVALVHAAAGRARAAEIVAPLAEVDVAVVAVGHDGAGAPPPASPARPVVVAAGGDASVGRLDLRLATGAPQILSNTVATLDKTMHEQLGVGLLARVATIPLTDSDKMIAEAKRTKTRLRSTDLYEIWDYGSTKACGYCHPKAVAQWMTTDHAHAFATLVKAKHDHDPKCLGCHTLGFVQQGGTRDMVMARSQFADVGCEGCHGPSALHVRSIDKKIGTVRAVDPIVCLGCHTPDQNIGAFDPVAAVKELLGPDHGAPGNHGAR